MWSYEIIEKVTNVHDMIVGHNFEDACEDAGLDPDMVRKNYWIYPDYLD